VTPSFEKQLEQVGRERDSRDVAILKKSLLPAAKSLKKSFGKWRTEEIAALSHECDLLIELASTTEAKNRLGEIKAQLGSIEADRVPSARDKIEVFIQQIQSKQMQNPKEVFKELKENLYPAVELIGDLMEFRETLDGMAAMIPRQIAHRDILQSKAAT
jgi:hypothetical protein